MGEEQSAETRTTPVDPKIKPDPREKDLSGMPIRQIVAFKREKNIWQVFAFASLLVAIGAILYFRSQEGTKPYVYVVDGAGTMHFGPLELLNPASSVYTTTALWATQAAYQRSPVGFDLPELVSAYFRADAGEKLKDDLKAQMPTITAESLHIKPEISSIQFIKESGKVAIMRVRGQLTRAGNLTEQEMRRPALPFVLNLAIVPNPRLSQKDNVPFVVSDYKAFIDYSANDEAPPNRETTQPTSNPSTAAAAPETSVPPPPPPPASASPSATPLESNTP
jgi:hypothetical protein